MLKALIVDDEAPARARLRRLLKKYPDIEITGEAADGLEALEKISTLKPDLVFLDIEMPEADGLSVASALGGRGPAIIFITAFDEFALRAFEVSAADYLLKPVSDERLEQAIKRARQLVQAGSPSAQLEKLREFLTTNETRAPERLALRIGAKYVIFDIEKIAAVIAKDHYSAILVDGRELLADDSLDELGQRLGSRDFMRIHRSAIVNLAFIRELEREGDRKFVACLSDPAKTRVQVSRERLDELKSRLGIA